MTHTPSPTVAEFREWLTTNIERGGRFRAAYLDALEAVDVFTSARVDVRVEVWPVEPIVDKTAPKRGRRAAKG